MEFLSNEFSFNCTTICRCIDANSGENFVMILFDLMLDYKLIPKHNFDEHLKKVYTLDEKERF